MCKRDFEKLTKKVYKKNKQKNSYILLKNFKISFWCEVSLLEKNQKKKYFYFKLETSFAYSNPI